MAQSEDAQGDDRKGPADPEVTRIQLELELERERSALRGKELDVQLQRAGVDAQLALDAAARAEQLAARRIKYGLITVISGLLVLAFLYVASLYFFNSGATDSEQVANNVVASMGAVTGVIGTLVSGYFGIQLGVAGRERAEAERDRAIAAPQSTRSPEVGEKVLSGSVGRFSSVQ